MKLYNRFLEPVGKFSKVGLAFLTVIDGLITFFFVAAVAKGLQIVHLAFPAFGYGDDVIDFQVSSPAKKKTGFLVFGRALKRRAPLRALALCLIVFS